jgi:aminoglycoside phosphotransferase (APT) family kinase protein
MPQSNRSVNKPALWARALDRTYPTSEAKAASKLAALHFGTNIASVVRFSEGMMNYMFQITTKSREIFVLRVYPAGRHKVAKYEAQLILEMHARGCFVPDIVSYRSDETEHIPAHLIYRYIHGATLASRRAQCSTQEMRQLAGALIDNLKLMASCEVRGYGGLVTAKSADCETAQEFFHRSMTRGIERAKETRVLPESTILSMQDLLDTAGPDVMRFDGQLAWGDLAPSNILIDQHNRLTAIVDFESTLALDHALSLGYLLAMSPDDPLIPLLLDEGARRDFAFDNRKIRLCAVLRAARMARFAHQPLPSGTLQRPIETILPGALRSLADLTASLQSNY